jgi:CRP-like cAMP-binding protein
VDHLRQRTSAYRPTLPPRDSFTNGSLSHNRVALLLFTFFFFTFAYKQNSFSRNMQLNHQATQSLRQILSQHCTPSDKLVNDLENVAQLLLVHKGEAVVNQGYLCNSFIFIHKGVFRVSHLDKNIEDTILFGMSGDVFTSLHSYYASEPAVFSLYAIEDSEVWLVSYQDMNTLLSVHKELLIWLNNLLIEQIYAFEKRYVLFNNKTAEERFINFLLDRYGSLRRAPIKYISSFVPLKYIAQYLKITQSTLSRLRRKLANKSFLL